jgi:anoctamin-10
MPPPKVDLVIVFRSSSGRIEPKALARQNARQASEQYAQLLHALKSGGLQAVGKRGERDGQLLVLVSCPPALLRRLAQRERCVAS